MNDEEDYEYEVDSDYHYDDDDGDDQGIMEDDESPPYQADSKNDRPFSAASAKNIEVDDQKQDEKLSDPKSNSNTPSGKYSNNLSSSSSQGKLIIPCDSYIVRPASDVIPVMQRIIQEVCNMLDISPDEAHLLLQYHKWDKDRLTDAFLTDFEKVRSAAGIDLFSNEIFDDLFHPKPCSSSSSSTTFHCRIRVCCDEICPWQDGFSLGCNHRFCRACFTEYLKNAVHDGPQCTHSHCPEHKCNQVIPRTVFDHFLRDPSDTEVHEKYQRFLLRNFIETNKNMRYCPAPRCELVCLASGSVTSVQCTCGHHFCFRCGEEAHAPASCQQMAQWTEKCMNESETANWILANTRKCPNCGTRIEKNQGCNHMNCRQCKYEFCWICMGNWAEHGQQTGGFYKCNRFDPTDLPQSVTEAQKAKAELDRYLHYYQRFHGHDQGLKFAEKLKLLVEKRMFEQQEHSRSTWMDVEFLRDAAEQVRDCRRVLKHTYVLGYFLKDRTPEKQLFEHHQEMLEKNTERLQEFTEKPFETLNRADVVNLTRVTERFLQSLLQNMSGGVVRMDDAMTNNGGVASEASVSHK